MNRKNEKRINIKTENNLFTERQGNVELLRIIAMLMIIAHHLVIHGIMHSYSSTLETVPEKLNIWFNGPITNKIFSCFLLPGGKIGAGLFFMISGYFLIGKNKPSKIYKLIYQGLFYSIIGIVIFIIFYLIGYNFEFTLKSSILKSIVKSLIAPYDNWWFFETYILLMLLMPSINYYFNNHSKNEQKRMLFMFWLLIYCVNMIMDNNLALIVRASFFYLLGGYINENCSLNDFRCKKISLIISSTIIWCLDSILLYELYNIEYLNLTSTKIKIIDTLLNFLDFSILSPLCAISIFLLFKSIKLKSDKINIIASTTFGIYLLHDNSVLREIIWHGILHIDTIQYSSCIFIISSLLSVIVIFIVGCTIDLIRQKYLYRDLLKN